MNKLKTKQYRVDGETRVGIWVNDDFKEEVDCNSVFNPSDAKEYLMSKYK
jgi:hypothetical protein